MKRTEFYQFQEETFDSFCKRVIHNTAIDLKKKAENRERLEISFYDLPEKDLAVPSFEFEIKTTECFQFTTCGMVVSVRDSKLGIALTHLQPSLRQILLLYYYCDFNMNQIATLLSIPISTVDYRHKRALKQLQRLMEVMNNG